MCECQRVHSNDDSNMHAIVAHDRVGRSVGMMSSYYAAAAQVCAW